MRGRHPNVNVESGLERLAGQAVVRVDGLETRTFVERGRDSDASDGSARRFLVAGYMSLAPIARAPQRSFSGSYLVAMDPKCLGSINEKNRLTY